MHYGLGRVRLLFLSDLAGDVPRGRALLQDARRRGLRGPVLPHVREHVDGVATRAGRWTVAAVLKLRRYGAVALHGVRGVGAQRETPREADPLLADSVRA